MIARANDTKYGLAAGVVTKSLDTANTLSRALKAGTIWVSMPLLSSLHLNLQSMGRKGSGIISMHRQPSPDLGFMATRNASAVSCLCHRQMISGGASAQVNMWNGFDAGVPFGGYKTR